MTALDLGEQVQAATVIKTEHEGWPDSSEDQSACLGREQQLGFDPWCAVLALPVGCTEMSI